MANLRDHLLYERVGQDADLNDNVQSLVTTIQESLSEVSAAVSVKILDRIDVATITALGWSAKYNISSWIRHEATRLSKFAAIEISGKPPLPGSTPFLLGHFLVMRDVLEALGDIAVLADVLRILVTTKQEAILAAMVDTIHWHALALSGMGAFESLQSVYGQAYISLRSARPCVLLFATALMDLCQVYPSSTTHYQRRSWSSFGGVLTFQ